MLQNYDYAIPSGIGFGGIKGGIFGLGDWLQQPLVERRVPLALHNDLVRRVMDDFTQVLAALASPVQNQEVHLVRTAGTLTASDWANEMHPTRAGFERLAECFRPLLRQAHPGHALRTSRRFSAAPRARSSRAPISTGWWTM